MKYKQALFISITHSIYIQKCNFSIVAVYTYAYIWYKRLQAASPVFFYKCTVVSQFALYVHFKLYELIKSSVCA